jgi:phosphoenolpyruvate carboxykinase (ATP)
MMRSLAIILACAWQAHADANHALKARTRASGVEDSRDPGAVTDELVDSLGDKLFRHSDLDTTSLGKAQVRSSLGASPLRAARATGVKTRVSDPLYVTHYRPSVVPLSSSRLPVVICRTKTEKYRDDGDVSDRTATEEFLEDRPQISELVDAPSSVIQEAAAKAHTAPDDEVIQEIFYNSPAGVLYNQALKHEKGSAITDAGALSVTSGVKTGRSPLDKRVVVEPESEEDVWWGPVNIKLPLESFMKNRQRAVDFLDHQKRLYIIDGWAGWDPENRIPVRVVTSRSYHALFMQNMLVPPKDDELVHFKKTGEDKPFVIFNAGAFPANKGTEGMTSKTSVAVSFKRKEMVILGTQYAGEMKKGVFTVMNYLMPLRPKRGVPPEERAMPMHASANIGPDNDVTIFFGLSGTGKTTLSADPKRDLIGDDEHVWTTKGVFNMEGGCYAKTIDLTPEKEPEVYEAIRFGSILENVGLDEATGIVDYSDVSITENTRVSYPLQYIPNARIPANVPHEPKRIIFLTCDAFGILPPISKLTPDQVMYYFIAGYTAKVAGTEMGITEPKATFSACFGAPFMVWHPYVYAEMLASKLEKIGAPCYLVNTGWSGGGYGVGSRMSLKYTRQLIDAIHDGTLDSMEWTEMPIFGLQMPTKAIKDVPKDLLQPKEAWKKNGQSGEKFDETANHLAKLFETNFECYGDFCTVSVVNAGPKPKAAAPAVATA